MKRSFILILVLLIGHITIGQVRAVILDNETRKAIPYVNIWIENEAIGTSSDEKGHFIINDQLADQIIVFSAIGYETKRIKAVSIKESVELTPRSVSIKEVTISANQEPETITIGSFKQSKINCYLQNSTQPWIVTRHYEYLEQYSKTPYLEKLKINTISETKDAKFNIRFYAVDSAGIPENYIYGKNVIATAKKGDHMTEVDLSNLKILFPKEGFFIAIEWLIIDSNKYEFTYKNRETKEKVTVISYSPKIGIITHDKTNKNWFFSEGKWRNRVKICNSLKNYNDTFNALALELTLSN